MRTVGLSAVKSGMTRLRDKGGASPESLYDLVNGHVDASRAPVQRSGTTFKHTLPAGTKGLTAFQGKLHVFSIAPVALGDSNYVLHVITHPTSPGLPITRIHFASGFLGYLYVAAEFLPDTGKTDGDTFHYWIQSGKPWAASTVYLPGDNVTPTHANGIVYQATRLGATSPVWAANTAETVGNVVEPTTPNGYAYTLTEAIGSAPSTGPTEPTWPLADGGVVYEVVDATNGTSASLTDAIPAWQPNTRYANGALVSRASLPSGASLLVNGSFAAGADHWTFGTGWALDTTNGYSNANSASLTSNDGLSKTLENTSQLFILPGQPMTAGAVVQQGAADSGAAAASVVINWYSSANVLLGTATGNQVTSGKNGAWHPSSVTAVAPANAAYAKVGAVGFNNAGASKPLNVDDFTVSYTLTAVPPGTLYKATQADLGFSAATEPVWPDAGGTVVDNQVTWQAILVSRLKWVAKTITKSGGEEPVWPLAVGGSVADGQISWVAISNQVKDVNCPHSKIVAIASSKIYAADDDVVRYSATANPLDWTTANDAGYLPYGLQNFGSNPVAAMNLYRSNLAIFNAEGMQLWQVDEDPASSALLDALPLASTQNRAMSPVSNDLFFLSSQGVRTVGIAATSDNLSAGDVGMPIDELIKASVAATTEAPLATYIPASGQYWLAFAPPASGFGITGDLPDMHVSQAISYQYGTVNASGTVAFSISSGSLPTGLFMSSTGLVTGSALYYGQVANWVVRARDASGEVVYLADTATVQDVAKQLAWWMVGSDAKLFENATLTNWTGATQYVRSPYVVLTAGNYARGYFQVSDTVLIGTSDAGVIERATGVTSTFHAPTTSLITVASGGENVSRLVVIAGIAFLCLNNTAAYYTSVDAGLTWIRHSAPDGNYMLDIARLANGRWIAFISNGPGGGFYYSDQPGVPTTWTAGTATVIPGAQAATVTNGAAAVHLGSVGYFRTTDGATWLSRTGFTTGSPNGSCGAANGNTFIIGSSNNGDIWRSTDAGLTFATVAVPGPPIGIYKIVYVQGMWVAMGNYGVWYSTDDGVTWLTATMPAGLIGTPLVNPVLTPAP